MSNKNNLQVYFGEILREFFDYGTPSYYRVQLSNPRTLLHELLVYCEMYNGTVHLKLDHIGYMIDEYLYYMSKDVTYVYYKDILVDFHSFLKTMKSCKVDKDPSIRDIYLLITRLKSILKEIDEKYYSGICKQINDLFTKSESTIDPKDFTKLKKICFSFSTEILRRGYSKSHIYDKIMEYLIVNFKFEDFINSFNGDLSVFSVYIKISGGIDEDIRTIFGNMFGFENVSENLFLDISALKTTDLALPIEKATSLLDGYKRCIPNQSLFLKFQESALDAGNALSLSKIKVNDLFDKINIEFPYKNMVIYHHGITINECGIAKMPSTTLQLDGYRMKSSISFFNSFNEKLEKILESKFIDLETKNKIQTLLQFHRHFSDADILEHKFLNLWIGWEHVFSLSIFKDGQTWKNIHTYFPYIHSLSYFENIFKDMLNVQLKRNIKNEQQRIRLKNELEIKLSSDPSYQLSNLYSLIKQGGINWDNFLVIPSLNTDDLTKVKLFRLKEKTKDPVKFISHIKEKTQWELFRMYRVRNAIVHKGNIKHLGLPIDVLLTQLEYFYQELLEIVIARLSCNERFSSIEQLFLAFERTYNSFIKEDGISKITNPADIKKKILNRPLIY